MKAIVKAASAVALCLAASAALADSTNVHIFGSFQNQVGGSGNTQTMDLGSDKTSPFGAFHATNLFGGQYNQVQTGFANRQTMRVAAIAPTANPFIPAVTNVSVAGAVTQLQSGFNNLQSTDIGVIY